MKIIYIGSSSPLSLIPLKFLIKSDHEVCAVAVDNDRNSDFNVITSSSIQSLAFNNSISLISLNTNCLNASSKIEEFQPDVIIVSCYARRLPQSILSLARKGSFNVHPSLLPKFRGPNPLFWQLREGVKEYGVTLHRMTNDFDAGDIISQKKVNIDDGLYIDDVTDMLASQAADLIIDTLGDIESDSLVELTQNKKHSSYQSNPEKDDYTVSTSWTAKRLYNFINAYKGLDVYFLCDIYGEKYKLTDAFSCQEVPHKNMNNKSIVIDEEKITFSCKDGYIQCGFKV